MADEQLLAQLKGKYQSVIEGAPGMGILLQNVHVENGKLLIRGMAPNEHIKNEIWNRIKAVDPSLTDLVADISVDPSLPVPVAATAPLRKYTVQAGDTLSKIAGQFYGKANEYTKIFEANRDKLSDPDKIRPGQVLVIP